MNLQMNLKLAESYTSKAQIARVLTENWLLDFGYCPSCSTSMAEARNNAQVHDFTCENCANQYELKSFLGKTPVKVNDGAYESMMKRIADIKSPHFFFLGYSSKYLVENCFAVPNYLFQASTIEKRKPLSSTARRAGWTGCLIRLDQIPEIGKIKLVENGKFIKPDIVKKSWDKVKFLTEHNDIQMRGWALDVLNCVEKLNVDFRLKDLYQYENLLSAKHPENKHVKDKIRQQLQVLRDKGVLEFTSRGVYRKINYE